MPRPITNLVLGSEGFIGKPFCFFFESLERKWFILILNASQEDLRIVVVPRGIDRVYFLHGRLEGQSVSLKRITLRAVLTEFETSHEYVPQLEKSGIPFFFLSSQYAEEYGTPYGTTKRLGEIWTRLLQMVIMQGSGMCMEL